MNFMKNYDPFQNVSKRRKRRTINFFQTVREGKRNFPSDQANCHTNCDLNDPWISGRKFLKPTRHITTSSCRTGTDVKTILSSIENHHDLGSSAAEQDLGSFFSESSFSRSTNKKIKSFGNDTKKGEISRCSNFNQVSGSSQFLSSGYQVTHSSLEGLPPSTNNSKEQPTSSNKCIGYNSTSTVRNKTNKKPPFDFEDLMANPNDSSKETFFKNPAVINNNVSFQEMIFKTVESSQIQTSAGEFFSIHNQAKSSLADGEFFKEPNQVNKPSSSIGFFKEPIARPQIPKADERLFSESIGKSRNSNGNEEFFENPVSQPPNPTCSSFEGFFKTPSSKSQKPADDVFFNKQIMPQNEASTNADFFKNQTGEENNSNKEFFNLPLSRPLNSSPRENVLKSTKEQQKKTNSDPNFLKTPSRKPEQAFFKTPSMESQKMRSHQAFLKPHLNPKFFASMKGSGKTSGSDPSSYEGLFVTPSKITSLPKMTTPHLFQTFEKVSSKTSATPASKDGSRTTSKTTNITNGDSPYYVLSVTEGRGCAICEIGIAAIDLKHPELILSQFSDVPTYKKLLTKIHLLDAAEVLMPETFKNDNPSEMYKKVIKTFPDVRVTTAKRIQFSAKEGLGSIRQLMLADDSSVECIIYKKYYALAAAEALLRYIEVKHSILFSPKTLKVTFQGAKDVVFMDLETCQRLELLSSTASVIFPEKYSMFGLLDCTKTMGGKRRLRACLMQPSSSQEYIEKRQNTVSTLLSNQASLCSLQTCLLKFSSVERLLWLCRRTPNFRNESNTFDILTNYILLLKGSLESVPHLRKVLEEIDDDQIVDIRDELYNEHYELMLKHIKTMIREDARLTKGYAAASRERCFAINEGVNDLLDLARATYSDLIEHVLRMVTELAEEYCLPLKMSHGPDMGFHATYVLPKKMTFNKEDVPEIFTEIRTKNRTVHLLTEEMFMLNVRINRAMEEIQLITNVVIYDLVESLKEGMSYLYRLCDCVADLDLLSSLAQVSSVPDYTRPVFGNQTSLIGARHPILDHLCPTKPIPNNIIVSKENNFIIVTGPNMSGKTIYVLTAPLIYIMAQVGCYVPADKAELRITDHIYVRKGNTDSLQCKLSSHGMEMKELLYNLKILTSRSLIVLDELCTNTTCERGICIGWAFCEEFLKMSASTFLTTHYHYLCNLSKIYKNVKNYHMEAIERNSGSEEIFWDLTFTYRLLPGVTLMTNYALRLMMASALPDKVKEYALSVAKDMTLMRETSLPVCLVDDAATRKEMAKIEKLENFMFNLKALSQTDKFTPKMIKTLQKMVREEILSDSDGEFSDDGSSDDNCKEWSSIADKSSTSARKMQEIVKDAFQEYFAQEELQNAKDNEMIENIYSKDSQTGAGQLVIGGTCQGADRECLDDIRTNIFHFPHLDQKDDMNEDSISDNVNEPEVNDADEVLEQNDRKSFREESNLELHNGEEIEKMNAKYPELTNIEGGEKIQLSKSSEVNHHTNLKNFKSSDVMLPRNLRKCSKYSQDEDRISLNKFQSLNENEKNGVYGELEEEREENRDSTSSEQDSASSSSFL